MNYIDDINSYIPINEQEAKDKKVIVEYIKVFHDNVLLRDNRIAHITSSGFIVNKSIDKVLMIHHNIRNAWAWTGGHADGDSDLLHVAIKEAKEETGIRSVEALIPSIASIDIAVVNGHIRKEEYVNPHLHLSMAYILIADEDQELTINKEENSGVRWIDLHEINNKNFSRFDVNLYGKLIKRAEDTK